MTSPGSGNKKATITGQEIASAFVACLHNQINALLQNEHLHGAKI
jgi:hypothetical protein